MENSKKLSEEFISSLFDDKEEKSILECLFKDLNEVKTIEKLVLSNAPKKEKKND